MPSDHDLSLLGAAKCVLTVHDEEALNAETPPHLLNPPLTPLEAFFVRNNGDVPDVGSDWALRIDGAVARPLSLTPDELRRRYATVTETAVLECAGNGRSQFAPATEGLPWGLGAVGCARWTGVRLADVLADAGVAADAVYIGHHSPDRQIGKDKPALSRGLPIAKALAPETLIAFAMNGEPLSELHGAPLRIVAPGFPGSAWQKWLARIEVRREEHDGEKMGGTNYRLPRRPLAPGEEADASLFDVIVDMKVKSLITKPAQGFAVPAGEVLVEGHAWSGSVPVATVDVSSDAGASWTRAALAEGEGPFAWRRFSARVACSPGAVALMARATDMAGNAQPLDGPDWNPRGYCNNRVHRVTGRVR